MELPTRFGAASQKTFWFLSGLALLTLVLTAMPSKSQAQTLVVADFSGTRKTKKVGGAARSAIAKALRAEGASLVSYKHYLRKAKRARISAKRALRARSIKLLSRKMNLGAVVTGSVKKRGRRYIVTVSAYSANGSRLVKKTYRLKRPRFPSSVANKFARLVLGKLGGGGGAEPEPPPVEPEPPPEPEVATGTGDTGGETGDAFLPPWARKDKKEGDTSSNTATSEKAKPAPRIKRRKKLKAGTVPEIFISAGLSMNKREGLHPRHSSVPFPGVRIDGRFFLGAFLDGDIVKDIGLGGMYNMSLGLKYGIEGGEAWNSDQTQWAGELLYRLAFNDVVFQPAFMLRVGYGSTSCTVETDYPMALSAGYSYPYAALDIHLTLYKPLLSIYASAGYLLPVSLSEDLSGDGSGFTVRAGINVGLFDLLFDRFEDFYIGLGWEMFQFTVNDDVIGETSDLYHSFSTQIGWNYK